MAKTRWLRVPTGAHEGLYQVRPWKAPVNLNDLPPCPCCQVKLSPVLDIIQWGYIEDKYITWFVCTPCNNAYMLMYTLPAYEMTYLSKEPAEGGIEDFLIHGDTRDHEPNAFVGPWGNQSSD